MSIDTIARQLELRPNDPDTWAAAAHQLVDLGQAEAAVPIAIRASQLLPGHGSASLLALVLARAGRADDATRLVEALAGEDPQDAAVWARLAQACTALDRHHDALVCRQNAVVCCPDDRRSRLLLAQQLERADRRDEARAHATWVLERAPDSTLAQRVLMRLDHHDGDLTSAAARGRDLLQRGGVEDDLVRTTAMEQARICARLGLPDEAVAAATLGNRLALRAWKGSSASLRASLAELQGRPRWPPIPDAVDEQGAFIVGFPRSGTTLMQQILEQHPATRTLDESAALDRAVDAVMPGLSLAEQVDALTPERAAQIRRLWRDQVGPGFVVDKLPLHLARIDLIARVFPGMPVVVMVRDPRDCVVSAFLQDFELNPAMAELTDVGSAARLYRDVFSIWQRARDAGGVRAREVRYEDLVRAPEQVLEGVLDFLGLPWDPSVLGERAGDVTTPSYRNVQEPLYDRSVQRWRVFEEHLLPAQPILEPFVEGYGYPPA